MSKVPPAVQLRPHVAVAVDAIGLLFAALSIPATLYVLAMLTRRALALSIRWSAGRLSRYLTASVAALACVASLAACWFLQGQLRGW